MTATAPASSTKSHAVKNLDDLARLDLPAEPEVRWVDLPAPRTLAPVPSNEEHISEYVRMLVEFLEDFEFAV
jgi:hypothetical protein